MTLEQRLTDARARQTQALARYQEIQKRTEQQRQEACDAYNTIFYGCQALAAAKATEKS